MSMVAGSKSDTRLLKRSQEYVAFDLETVMSSVSAFQNRYSMFAFGNAMMARAKDYGREKFVAITVCSIVACPALVCKRCCGCIVLTLLVCSLCHGAGRRMQK